MSTKAEWLILEREHSPAMADLETWAEYRKLVLAELERMSKALDQRREDAGNVMTALSNLRIELTARMNTLTNPEKSGRLDEIEKTLNQYVQRMRLLERAGWLIGGGMAVLTFTRKEVFTAILEFLK